MCASINSLGNRFCGKNEVLSNDYETHMGLIAFNRFHVSKNATLEIAWRLMAMNITGWYCLYRHFYNITVESRWIPSWNTDIYKWFWCHAGTF